MATARPTTGALTTAGFTNTTAAKYTKTVGTITSTVDLAAGTLNSGVVSIAPAAPGTPITLADYNTHAALLASLGLPIVNKNEALSTNLVYYGQTA